MSLEFNLVKFPLIFPLIYGSILYLLPDFENYLIFLTILLLAETHFGATWPFFLNNANAKFIKENRISLISFPVIIATASLIGFIFLKPTFLLIFFAVNMYHVTRQSFGVCKLYTKEILQIKYQENFIYIFNFIFFLIGFFRFYFPLISANYILLLNVIIIALTLFTIIFYYFRYGISDSFYTFVTGLIIFYPICFVANPVHAIIMGVTMHYTQYLYLTHIVFKGRREDKVIKTSKLTYLGVIAMYAIAMAILSLFGKSSNEILNFLIIIPIIGQMLHFYLDSQLWKFSKEHNRVNTLKFIKSN
ncbi:hypothetical protein OAP15_03930 [Candidatus Pelagibacter sp.]|nr:hypothetical protein [Candidatus Pelagibacter sp.]